VVIHSVCFLARKWEIYILKAIASSVSAPKQANESQIKDFYLLYWLQLKDIEKSNKTVHPL
jgi:hypothetical protein